MKKKLYRNTEDTMIAGVVSGLADYFEFDTTIARLLVVLGVFFTGIFPGVVFYIIAMFIIPEKPTIEPLDKADYTVYQ